MILAFCLSVALLPAQAFAATTDDDPATWPAPDSHYTAPDKNPVYLFLDYTDEDNGGIRASHYGTNINRFKDVPAGAWYPRYPALSAHRRICQGTWGVGCFSCLLSGECGLQRGH